MGMAGPGAHRAPGNARKHTARYMLETGVVRMKDRWIDRPHPALHRAALAFIVAGAVAVGALWSWTYRWGLLPPRPISPGGSSVTVTPGPDLTPLETGPPIEPTASPTGCAPGGGGDQADPPQWHRATDGGTVVCAPYDQPIVK